MPPMKVVLVACDLVTPYGWGIESCWNGLLSGRTAIGPFNRFGAESFQTRNAALVPDLSLDPSESLVMQMLRPMLGGKVSVIPRDALLIMASTTGEIEILQEHVLSGSRDASGSCLDRLLNKVAKLIGVVAPGMVVSSACASSSMAIAVGAAAIRDGESDCVLVVACDSVSEFVFSGFSALMALDKDAARPFDRNRTGLSLGESAGYVLLMSSARALQENRPVMGEVAGWGLTNDANHMTGPSRDGSGLTMAIRKALEMADIPAETVGCVSAHGTGTPYNDSMEMKAFKQVFETEPIPVYSIKGGTGHTLGAAGLVEAIVAFKSLEAQCAPPTVNLVDVDDEARGWAAAELQPFRGETTISTNSGFGGVNCALVLKKREKDRSSDTSR